MAQLISLSEAVEKVPSGSSIGFGGGNALWRRPLSFVRELIRQDKQDLEVHVMLGGLETNMLLGAGRVRATHASYVGLEALGHSNHFQRLVRENAIEVNEYTEFGFIATLRAASMGLPYIPWKTGIGSDVVKALGWNEVNCPYTGTRLLAVPAANIDTAVLQVSSCDEKGNVEVLEPHDFIFDLDHLVARAARQVIVCAEEIRPLTNPSRAGLIAREVDFVVHAPKGAWPGGIVPNYGLDDPHLENRYLPAAATPEAFAEYLDEYVFSDARA